MENDEGRDKARRKELLVKGRGLMRLCDEIIGTGAGAVADGQKLTL